MDDDPAAADAIGSASGPVTAPAAEVLPPATGSDREPPGEAPASWTRRHRWIVETVAIVIVAVVVAVLLRAFVVQTYFIPSGSMLPTLHLGDRIVVDKLSYRLHGVGRGDIVVFARPPAEDCGGAPVNDLVKRVVALPGETISLRNDRVLINGKPLTEPWLPPRTPTEAVDDGRPYDLLRPYKVPAGDYFVMGDNRTESCDSRYWGPIPKSLIVGKVVMRIWPLSRIHFF
jgi:signal peptidase I